MMTKRSMAAVLACAVLIAMTLVASAQSAGGMIRVLIVDETKTFASTMRVAGLVGALRQVPIFEVGVVLADVTSDWDDPLAGRVNDNAPYDIAVVLPRGIDRGTAVALWIVSDGLAVLPNDVRAAVDIVAGIASQVFAGAAEAKNVHDDLFPALLWGLYVREGWMR